MRSTEIFPLAHFILTSALAHLSQISDARVATQGGLALDRAVTIQRFRVGASSDNPTYLAQRERVYDGMHKARLPEG